MIESIKFYFLFVCAYVGEFLGRLALTFGLGEKWEAFTDWLTDDFDEGKAHVKIFSACCLIVVSLVILLFF